MQRLKKQKVQEILDAQNAAIDADMVRTLYWDIEQFSMICFEHTTLFNYQGYKFGVLVLYAE